jgi:hypothetical protein
MIYFQVPDELVSSKKLSKLKDTSLRLFLLILAMAQRKSSPTIYLTTEEIKETGISKNYVSSAVKQLGDLRLVTATQHKGKRWGYTFDLLDPETGLPLPTMHERKLDASKLTQKQLQTYFLSHLATNFSHFDDNGFWAKCPFHFSAKPKATLSVKTVGSGAWKCHEETCSHNCGGSVIDFEMAIRGLQGKWVNTKVAWERIVFVIRASERKEVLEKQSHDEALVSMAS